MARFAKAHLTTLKKTGSYCLMHMVVAASVAYAVTGDLWMALTLSLLEPTVQAVAFFFHEKAWERRQRDSVDTRENSPTPDAYYSAL